MDLGHDAAASYSQIHRDVLLAVTLGKLEILGQIRRERNKNDATTRLSQMNSLLILDEGGASKGATSVVEQLQSLLEGETDSS